MFKVDLIHVSLKVRESYVNYKVFLVTSLSCLITAHVSNFVSNF